MLRMMFGCHGCLWFYITSGRLDSWAEGAVLPSKWENRFRLGIIRHFSTYCPASLVLAIHTSLPMQAPQGRPPRLIVLWRVKRTPLRRSPDEYAHLYRPLYFPIRLQLTILCVGKAVKDTWKKNRKQKDAAHFVRQRLEICMFFVV